MSTLHERMEPRPEPKGDGHLQYLITAYLFENISDAGRREVEGHLAVCAQCRAELAELRATLLQVEDAIAPGAPDAAAYSFEARRLERVLGTVRPRGLGGFLNRHRGYLGLAAAALILVVVTLQIQTRDRSGARGRGFESSAAPASPAGGGPKELADGSRMYVELAAHGGSEGPPDRSWKDGAGAPAAPTESPAPLAAPASVPVAVEMFEHRYDSNTLGAAIQNDYGDSVLAGTVPAPTTHLYARGDDQSAIRDLEAGEKSAPMRAVRPQSPAEADRIAPAEAARTAKPRGLSEEKPSVQVASTFALDAKGNKTVEELSASNEPEQKSLAMSTSAPATPDVATRSKERFAEGELRVKVVAEVEKAGAPKPETALDSNALAWQRMPEGKLNDGLQIGGVSRESRDAPLDEYFVESDPAGEALAKRKDDAKPTPEKAPAPVSGRRRERDEADVKRENRSAGDDVAMQPPEAIPQAFGQYWSSAGQRGGIALQGLGTQSAQGKPSLLARQGGPGGGGGAATPRFGGQLEVPRLIVLGDFDAIQDIGRLMQSEGELGQSAPTHNLPVELTSDFSAPHASFEKELLGEAQQDGERHPPVRYRAAVETALRGFQHYRSLDPGLKAKAYFAHPATVPAPTVGDEGLGEAGFKARYGVNPFVDTQRDHFSTFGMDVDTASYTLARSALQSGRLPDPKTVRVEEFVNYFREDAAADPGAVFAVRCEGGPSPFGEGLDLLKITVKARDLLPAERKDAVLTFAVDTSGSMNLDNRLALVRGALESLVGSLKPDDRVAIVAFGANPYLVLPHTPARDRERILSAVHSLAPGGGTNVEAGLDLAYRVADEVLEAKAVNRVILCSDGVANVGARGPEEILKKAEVFAKRGIYLSSIGVGRGKYNDAMLETLSKKGNGNYAYVDSPAAAVEIFEKNLPSTLQVLAQDAKIQVDFNADVVSHYRLLGYEKRDIADSDFRNNKVDAGEVGPGSTVTVLYEIRRKASSSGDLGRIYLRYLDTGTGRVDELNYPVPPGVLAVRLEDTSDRFRFIASVAETAELLRGSYWARNGSYGKVESLMNTVSPELQARPEWKEVLDLIARARELTIQKLVSQ